jgi:hypothetical protein
VILVSSFRPQADCPKKIWENQEAANRSWTRIAERIFYFNKGDPRMKSAKTAFIPTEVKPPIKKMAAFCPGLNSWSAIVNADIIIPQNFRRVEDAMNDPDRAVGCVVSRRYTLPKDGDTSGARLADLGLDFFAATPTVWKAVAEKMPPEFLMGRIVWDNWIVNFFMAEFGNFCYDITPARVIFHPMHEDRTDQNWDFPKNDEILAKHNWPFHSISI